MKVKPIPLCSRSRLCQLARDVNQEQAFLRHADGVQLVNAINTSILHTHKDLSSIGSTQPT